MLHAGAGVPVQEVVDLPGRRARSGSISVNGDPPDGLCTTLESIPCPPTSMYSSKISAKPNTSW